MEKNTNTNTNTKNAKRNSTKARLARLEKHAATDKFFFSEMFRASYRLGEHLKMSEVKAMNPRFYGCVEKLRSILGDYAAAAFNENATDKTRRAALGKVRAVYNELKDSVFIADYRIEYSAAAADSILSLCERISKIDGKRSIVPVSASTLCNRILDRFAALVDNDKAMTVDEYAEYTEAKREAAKAKKAEEKRAAAAEAAKKELEEKKAAALKSNADLKAAQAKSAEAKAKKAAKEAAALKAEAKAANKKSTKKSTKKAA